MAPNPDTTLNTGGSAAPLRVAVVGCGAIAEMAHLPALASLQEQFRITALVDRNRERTESLSAGLPENPVCLDTTDDLARTADVAVVASPPHTHVEVVTALLKQGIHVLCEKPLGRTAAECDEMMRAAQTSAASLSVGFNRRYYRSWRLLRELVERGTLGQLLTLHIEEGTQFNWPVTSAFIFDKELSGGGVLLDTAVHLLDLVIWLASDTPRTVYYEDDSAGGVEANCFGVFTSGGQAFSLRLSRTHDLLNRAVATFEGGVVSAECWDGDPVEQVIWKEGAAAEVLAIRESLKTALPDNPFVGQWMDLGRRIRSGAAASDEDARTGIALVEECYASRMPMAQPWSQVAEAAQGGMRL